MPPMILRTGDENPTLVKSLLKFSGSGKSQTRFATWYVLTKIIELKNDYVSQYTVCEL